jgi:hypothetical protein
MACASLVTALCIAVRAVVSSMLPRTPMWLIRSDQSIRPPAANPGSTNPPESIGGSPCLGDRACPVSPELIAFSRSRFCLVAAALTTNSPLDSATTIESEVPVPGPLTKPPVASPPCTDTEAFGLSMNAIVRPL